MPTARPIITIISVTKNTRPKNCPMSAAMPIATMMHTSDRPMGMSTATTVPKSTTRMSSATGMPTRSPCCRSLSDSSFCSWATLASPTVSTRNPSPAFACSTTSSTAATLSTASSKSPVIRTGMRVVMPSGDRRPCRISGLAAL